MKERYESVVKAVSLFSCFCRFNNCSANTMEFSSMSEEEQLIDFEEELRREYETLVEIKCPCGEYTFSKDEIQMGSLCPNCFHDSTGRGTKD